MQKQDHFDEGQTVIPAKPVLIYDDHCPLCTRQVGLLMRLNWQNKITFCPASSPRTAMLLPETSPEKLLTKMHLVKPDGQVITAARAVRYISFQLPLLFPLAVLLSLPGAIHPAEWLYAWIAKRRYSISSFLGCKTACQWPGAVKNKHE